MAPKQKPTKPSPKNKMKSQSDPAQLATANDFLEAADEFERAAGKWRAGDAAKAQRFYARALAAYDEGLGKFPADFDLAFNKAHLQYSMTEDTYLSPYLGDPIPLLNETLLAHRYALNLDQGNADALFNTAQVLTSLAEKLYDSKNGEGEASNGSVELLHEAVELFAACLAKQEMEFEEFKARREGGDDAAAETPETDGSGDADGDPDSAGSETWAAVIEPVTPSTLIESALAQLSCLTTLISISAPAESSTVARIAELAAGLIQSKLPQYVALLPEDGDEKDRIVSPTSTFLSVSTSMIHTSPTDPPAATSKTAAVQEIQLTSVLFQAALADTEYRSRLSSAQAYSARLASIFDPLTQPSDPPSLFCAYADALMDFASSLSDDDGTESAAALTPLCWTSLSHADALLNTALTLHAEAPPTAAVHSHRPPSILLLRGDVALLRRQLALLPTAAASVASGAGTLLHNAGTHYRGAANLARRDDAVVMEARIKAAVVRGLEEGGGGGGRVGGLFAGLEMGRVGEVVEDMIEEGLVEDGVRGMLG